MENNKKNGRQTNRIRPIKGKEAEILIDNKSYFKEELPLPYVFYSKGTFIAFSKTETSKKYFCSCTKAALENYFELKKSYSNENYELDFPHSVNVQLKENRLDYHVNSFYFKENICHKCNLATPSIRSVHPMYGGKFLQFFGWYMSQQSFAIGILGNEYLAEKCPNELINLVEEKLRVYQEFEKEKTKLEKLSNSTRYDIDPNEITYWHNVKLEEAETYIKLQRRLGKLTTQHSNFIENIVRKEFGFRKVGEGWISESILFKIIKRLFPDPEIKKHYRPDWMEGLELDIFIPKLSLAFEYQGKQHYYPVKAWGGEKALKKVQERDKRKVQICKQKKITLIKIDYTEPLTEKHIKSILEGTVPNIG